MNWRNALIQSPPAHAVDVLGQVFIAGKLGYQVVMYLPVTKQWVRSANGQPVDVRYWTEIPNIREILDVHEIAIQEMQS